MQTGSATDQPRPPPRGGRRDLADPAYGGRPGPARRDRVDLRVGQRVDRLAWGARRGCPVRDAGQLRQWPPRAARAELPRGGVRVPAGQRHRHQRTERRADPALGRRRAVGPPDRDAAQPRTGARPAHRRAAPGDRVDLTGRAGVRIRSTRLVSLPRRPVAAVRYEVEPLDTPVELRVCSDLLANEKVPERSDDPRAASVPTDPLTAETYRATRPRRGAGAPHRAQRPARRGRGQSPAGRARAPCTDQR